MVETEEKLETIEVVKRNGKKVEFDGTKVALAIKKGFDSILIEEDEKKYHHLTFKVLLVQGIATSIDALSVGFTFVEEGYNWLGSLVCSLIISVVTFGICITGVLLGKKFGTKLAGKATILGGTILIIIGIVIFVKGMGFLPFLK